jgi:NADPH-dependent 2,4-dienoyl-CoA reductase/sulfur reductase-like enzyme
LVTQVPADLVIVGLGVTPATDWPGGSGLHLHDGVLCDATGAVEGSTGDAAVVAAGDVARWWLGPSGRRRMTTCRISGPINTT